MYFWVLLQLYVWWYFASLTLEFQHYHHVEQRPIQEFILWWMIAFLIYTVACLWIKNHKSYKLVVFSALLFRLLLVPSNPVQEDDFYRYLWDGASLAQGINPYLFAPHEVMVAQSEQARLETQKKLKKLEKEGREVFKRDVDDLMYDLHRLGGLANRVRINELHYDENWNPENLYDKNFIPVIERVNHGILPTVYPPLAQGVFALSAHFQEGSLWMLRFLFVLIEMFTLYCLIKTLRLLGLNPVHVAWYAWNPLVIKEFINSPHLDVLLVACTAAFMYAYAQRRMTKASLWIGVGILAKLVSVVFLPFIVLWHRRQWFAVVLACMVAFFGFSFFNSAGSRQWESLQVMGIGFRMNSISQDVVSVPVVAALELFGKDPYQDKRAFDLFHLFPVEEDWSVFPLWKIATRQVMTLLSCLWIAFMLWRSRALRDPLEQLIALSITLTGLLVLSPVANPWYFGILMLFLPLRPRPSFLVIGALLGLYYYRFYFEYHLEGDQVYDAFSTVVNYEWAGIILVLIGEWSYKKKMMVGNKT